MPVFIFIMLFLSAAFFTGCSSIPCYPPSYYAPEMDAPYISEEVTVPTEKGYHLAGTLTIPSGTESLFPAVVLVTGSSPQNRDMMSHWSEPYCNFRPFRQIADTLSRKGIAVLRLDDQGVACSGGGPFKNITIQERAADIMAALDYLRMRREIDKNRLGILGISEGANIASFIAADDPTVRAIVMMAGSATNGWKILEYQYRYELEHGDNLSSSAVERKVAKKMRNLRRAVKKGKGNPWLMSFLSYMPFPTAAKVTCPALILHGDKDAHVPVSHAELLAQAMRSNGNDLVTVKILKNVNHPFLKDSDGRKSRYKELLSHTNQLSDDLLMMICDWLSMNLS